MLAWGVGDLEEKLRQIEEALESSRRIAEPKRVEVARGLAVGPRHGPVTAPAKHRHFVT